jgi:hypothetical protein
MMISTLGKGIEKARQIVDVNGLSDKITLLQGKMEEVNLPFPNVHGGLIGEDETTGVEVGVTGVENGIQHGLVQKG